MERENRATEERRFGYHCWWATSSQLLAKGNCWDSTAWTGWCYQDANGNTKKTNKEADTLEYRQCWTLTRGRNVTVGFSVLSCSFWSIFKFTCFPFCVCVHLFFSLLISYMHLFSFLLLGKLTPVSIVRCNCVFTILFRPYLHLLYYPTSEVSSL